MGIEIKVEKFLNPHCREKLLLRDRYPYRNPTQVNEESILMPTGEAVLVKASRSE